MHAGRDGGRCRTAVKNFFFFFFSFFLQNGGGGHTLIGREGYQYDIV